MSEHTQASNRILVMVAVVFFGFGGVELLVAVVLGRAAGILFADGIHNLADGATMMAAYAAKRWCARVGRLVVRNCGSVLVDLALGLMGLLSYAAALLLDGGIEGVPSGVADPRQAACLIIVGWISLEINLRCHGRLPGHGHDGAAAHLIGDAVAGAAVIATAAAMVFAPLVVFAPTAIAIAALVVMAMTTGLTLWPTIKSLLRLVTVSGRRSALRSARALVCLALAAATLAQGQVGPVFRATEPPPAHEPAVVPPSSQPLDESAKPPEQKATQEHWEIHIVAEGESLSLIAQQVGLKNWRPLFDVNLDISNPNLIFPGQKVMVPSAGAELTHRPLPPAFWQHPHRKGRV